MDLLILDESFNELGTIEEFSSLQWTRRYYDFGDFELDCNTNYFNLIEQGTYLFRKGYELAFIDEMKYTRNSNNKYSLSIKGNFITSMLNDRVIIGEKKFTGTHEEIARQILNENFINPIDVKRKVNNLSLKASRSLGESTSLEVKNDVIGDTLNDFLAEKELSQIINYNYLTNSLEYEVWKGLDRTEEQSLNAHAVFSDNFETIADAEYSKDLTDYKNFVYVIGKDDKTITVDKVNGRRREMIVTSSDSVDADLKNKGNQELDKNKIVEVIDCTVISTENLLYKRDYDLGDLCTVKVHSIERMANMRITEIREVYEDGEVTILPKFGDDYITISKFIEREVKK
ncbi:siphovirus ReqiPepy6 Gp37-like family protein [Anaerorhabdus sp.]|uniref:siphovirus ReqiPepy6 Gp37-like family protein n=2 Tax=Anaerorhabdus sp. TaxID=1872524 RepID=UPI002FC8E496